MNLRYQIEYGLTASLLGLCRCLPKRAVISFFKGLGGLMYYLLKSRTRIVIRNMEIAFPEMDLKARKKLAMHNYKFLAESLGFSALVMSGRLSNEEILAAVDTEGWENYERAIEMSDKGILVFSGHMGNWELMPLYAALRLEQPLHVIARETNNPLLEEKIVKPLRERFGVSVFYKKNAIRYVIKVINKGDCAGMMIDQKLNPPAGIFVKFFNRDAPTSPSPAFLQVRLGIIALPTFMIKAANGKYKLIIREPIQWTDNGKTQEEQVRELTILQQQAAEQIIREYPEQWFWMHNRWNLKKGEY